MKNIFKLVALITAITCAGTLHAEIHSFGTGINAFDINFANIGNAGNDAFVHQYGESEILGAASGSPTSYFPDEMSYGSVGYNYRIATLEVSIEQFNKAEAASPSDIGSGFEGIWNGVDGYTSIPGTDIGFNVGEKAPAGAVTFYAAARFVNWMTSEDPHLGVYQFDSEGNYLGTDRQSAIVDYGIAYALPTEDEWFKAAYYDTETDAYSLYSNGLDTTPSPADWNYYTNGAASYNPSDSHGFQSVWEVGSGTNELNGTYDMMGNVWEWTEMNTNDSRYALRGGSAYGDEYYADSETYRLVADDPSLEQINVGFRVVAIPEPNTIVIMLMAGAAVLGIRRIFCI